MNAPLNVQQNTSTGLILERIRLKLGRRANKLI